MCMFEKLICCSYLRFWRRSCFQFIFTSWWVRVHFPSRPTAPFSRRMVAIAKNGMWNGITRISILIHNIHWQTLHNAWQIDCIYTCIIICLEWYNIMFVLLNTLMNVQKPFKLTIQAILQENHGGSAGGLQCADNSWLCVFYISSPCIVINWRKHFDSGRQGTKGWNKHTSWEMEWYLWDFDFLFWDDNIWQFKMI